MSETDTLKESIRQYEEQLLQVQQALAVANGSNRNDLMSLESDLNEIIQLSKESLGESENASCSSKNESRNCIDDEYNLFKAELAQLEDPKSNESSSSTADSTSKLEEELKVLEGQKCRAPHGSIWGGISYHNAMICSIHKSDKELSGLHNIMVRVLFIHPTHKEMLPCPYFLNGSCKFSEEQCHFSHGELIPFSRIMDYREPDFLSIRMGSRVLAKQPNKLWHRSVILRIPDDKDDEYQVKFEASGKVLSVGVDEICPLDDEGLEMSDSSDDSDYEKEVQACRNEELVHNSLLTNAPTQRLGDWEQHTRGIGSKLMAQMGYIVGTGLGKKSDGRIDPVEAIVLPAGKSLDHCMTLRENAGGDKDLFSVERKMQRQKKKMDQQRQKEYLKMKHREKNDVFNFMNTTLGDKRKDSESSSSKTYKDLKKESDKNLSVVSYKIGGDISRLEKESSKLQKHLKQFSQGSVQYNNIASKYNETQKQISKLKASEKRIASEQNQRKLKMKMTEF
ncbi:zinc finger CCCH-type with G patch domain-containing protein [Phymastichus coffea]|uniref:zinc finger CCCH-type with G patch domain-containing protein n=1 Tax=Phymastichus coffea TaxID=108790 RepID=UPI00273CBA9F|nr:zinc finger CCCH-type with G patch domain-containing protein [Phymastichus coffea]